MSRSFLFILLTVMLSCSKPPNNKGNVSFFELNDTTKVIYENKLPCPVFTKITNLKNGKSNFIQSKPNETSLIMQFNTSKKDSSLILETYKFSHYYGYHEKGKQGYDTLHNYALPFPKGKRYKIIQGYNGSFTHNTDFSRYTIDFNLKIGDTITASRSGIVIKVIDTHNKQGTTKKYKPYGNFIMIYHNDNTFAQYVHLKQHGALVKKGDSISINQPIGISGFTGLTTTPHLHFGVFKPTTNGFKSIPIILDSISGRKYTKNKIAVND
ncbi:M23 family metallopeptidase [Seonamhaeicola sp. ML3]|uniref:M23 family metallopeptidase n=1 Tax=Seonamhaeicola sp. ML3 TaxID=2937786 RepID=UPI00200E7C58|nr:M23 family metallopeptidase [Seonamhaeicola sp. ML3]